MTRSVAVVRSVPSACLERNGYSGSWPDARRQRTVPAWKVLRCAPRAEVGCRIDDAECGGGRSVPSACLERNGWNSGRMRARRQRTVRIMRAGASRWGGGRRGGARDSRRSRSRHGDRKSRAGTGRDAGPRGFRLTHARHRRGFPCCCCLPLHACPANTHRNRPVPAPIASRPLSAFPVYSAGRLPHYPFRRLLSVHSRCGLRVR